jgi:hypothetical protein
MRGSNKKMKKSAMLFLGIVVLCLVVIIVMNFILIRFEQRAEAPRVDKGPAPVNVQQPQAQPPPPEEDTAARPEYEATVSNGTILF